MCGMLGHGLLGTNYFFRQTEAVLVRVPSGSSLGKGPQAAACEAGLELPAEAAQKVGSTVTFVLAIFLSEGEGSNRWWLPAMRFLSFLAF